MQIKETQNENLKRAFECVVPAADIEKAVDAELKKLSRNAKIAGFRPGHVPAQIMKQRYGKSVVSDVVRGLVTDGVTKAINDKKLRPAVQPKLIDENFEEGKDLKFSFSLEIMPDVPTLKYESITINREQFEIEDADIDDALKRLAERSPEPKELPKATKAKKGNVVTMDFVGKLDGVAFEGGSAKEYDIELGSSQLIAGFEEQLEGVKAGDEKRIEVTFPENYFNKDLANKPTTFDITVHKVSELTTPEITEEFAKAKGFSDLRALREAVRDQLRKEFDSLVRTNMKRELFDALEEEVDFPIPDSMFDLEFDSIWQKIQAAKDEDPDLKGKSDKELKEEYSAIASRRVRLGILLAEIGRVEKLSATREELTRALLAYAGNFPGQEQRVLEFYRNQPERLDEFRGPILEDKAVDWIFSKIKYDDKKTSIKDLMEAAEKAESGDVEKPKKKNTKAKSTKSKSAKSE